MDDDARCRWCRRLYAQHVDNYGPGDPVPRMPCLGLKSYFYEEIAMAMANEVAEAFKLDTKAREAAHRRLDRWIAMCEHAADDAYEEGRSGYLGQITLTASVDDEGVSLRVESSLTEGV